MSNVVVDDDEDYYIPLTDQRVFGAGIKRKGITFVPATTEERSVSAPLPSTSTSAGDRYLSIVLGKKAVSQDATTLNQDSAVEATVQHSEQSVTCPVCNQPVDSGGDDRLAATGHETSIAHQVCMRHSHPPSHLDRDHMGLKYLSGFGWDPDARKGLGARAEGIRVPIKAREKRDTSGLGVNSADADDDAGRVNTKPSVKKEGKVVKLNLKEVRKLEHEKQKRAERLRQVFYGEDLSQYLGPGE